MPVQLWLFTGNYAIFDSVPSWNHEWPTAAHVFFFFFYIFLFFFAPHVLSQTVGIFDVVHTFIPLLLGPLVCSMYLNKKKLVTRVAGGAEEKFAFTLIAEASQQKQLNFYFKTRQLCTEIDRPQ